MVRHELHEQRHQGACFWHVMQGIDIDPTPKIGTGRFTWGQADKSCVAFEWRAT